MATSTVTTKLRSLTARSRDDSVTEITVCTWNIMGTASAKDRKKVTTATLQHPFKSDGSPLGLSDIIFLQGMKFDPQREEERKEYLPFACQYGVVQSQEPGSNTYNGVFYNKDKFSEASVECLQTAYTLMDYKRECYEEIKQGSDYKITDDIKGNLSEWGDSDEKRKMCNEVFQECKAAGSTRGFYDNIARYRSSGEDVTTHPEILLNSRIALQYVS